MLASSDLANLGAGALAQALRSRRLSALEACDAAIARIEAGDRDINAVVVRDFDRARDQARAADAALARGEQQPLLGVPMTVKESFDIAGLPTTWGFDFARRLPVTQDALAVSRLKAAGAVLLGKTNCALALADWQTANPIHGRTANPLDLSRTPGGSSGGAAAALAAGFVPLELGSDLVGSIRIPAHFCGLFGHRPSQGLLPRRGHDFPGHDGATEDPLSVIGPLARHADDLALALDVLAGPDANEAIAWRLALPPPRHARIADLRVLVVAEHPAAAASGEVRAALDQFADALAREGATVSRTNPLLPDPTALLKAFEGLLMAFVTQGQPGPVISAHEWLALLDEQARVRRRCAALFEQVDVVLMPPFGTAAFAHIEEPDMARRRLRIDGVDTPYEAQGAWSALASFAGLPVTVVPVARTAEGLPVGVQIIGPALHDRTTLAVARWWESRKH
ncbi:MAG TPA: amidase family protein [Albitalea sp.]|uniref:amidase family protein n=1 Tax=Piscinibacter sp. TaxID=1903157 RepID=UPI002ED576EE